MKLTQCQIVFSRPEYRYYNKFKIFNRMNVSDILRVSMDDAHDIAWDLGKRHDTAHFYETTYGAMYNERKSKTTSTSMDIDVYNFYYIVADEYKIPLRRLIPSVVISWCRKNKHLISTERDVGDKLRVTLAKRDGEFLKELAKKEKKTINYFITQAVEMFASGELKVKLSPLTKPRLRHIPSVSISTNTSKYKDKLTSVMNDLPLSMSLILTRIVEDYIYEFHYKQ